MSENHIANTMEVKIEGEMEVDDAFDTYEDFVKALEVYSKRENVQYCVSDSKLITNVNKKVKFAYDEKFRFRYIRYECKFGMRNRLRKVKGNIASLSQSDLDKIHGCEATLVVSVDKEINKFVIRKHIRQHNHECTEESLLQKTKRKRRRKSSIKTEQTNMQDLYNEDQLGVCFVHGCNHGTDPDIQECSMFIFPCSLSESDALKQWEQKCRRKDRAVTSEDMICSCHFKGGNRENGPTIFPWARSSLTGIKRKRKAAEVTEEYEVEIGQGENNRVVVRVFKGEEDMQNNTLGVVSFTKRKWSSQEMDQESEPDIEESYDAGHSFDTGIWLSIQRLADENVKMKSRLTVLEEDNKKIKEELEKLRNQNNRSGFSIDDIIDDHEKMLMYTSVPKDLFLLLADTLRKLEPIQFSPKGRVNTISLANKLLMTLIKLKLNCRVLDLAHRFNCGSVAVVSIFRTLLPLLHQLLHDGATLPSGMTIQLKYTGNASPATCLQIYAVVDNVPPQYKSLEIQILEVCTALLNIRVPYLKRKSPFNQTVYPKRSPSNHWILIQQ